MLFTLVISACTGNDPGDSGRLTISNEADSSSGAYHLEALFTPDPPAVGDQDLELVMTWNTGSEGLEGALVVGATLTGTLEGPGVSPLLPSFTEGPLGSYMAHFTWSAAGYWELHLTIGDLEQDDSVAMAFEVEET